MKKMYNIHYTNRFTNKMDQIYNYILYELQNPISAYNFKIKLMQTISILYYFPQAGPKFQNTKYRYLTLKHWIILYEINNYEIEIVQIFSSKQNLNFTSFL